MRRARGFAQLVLLLVLAGLRARARRIARRS